MCGELSEDNIIDSEVPHEIDDNGAKLKDNRLEGKFVRKNVINLSQRQLTKSEMSLLSKRLKFVPHLTGQIRLNLKKSWRLLGEN